MTGTWHKSERCEERDPGENSERQVGVKREVTKIHGGEVSERDVHRERDIGDRVWENHAEEVEIKTR